MLHQIKAQQFHNDLGLLSTLPRPTANSKTQGLFKLTRISQCTF